MERLCEWCGKRYSGRGKKFCSHNCWCSYRNKVNNPMKNPETRLKMIKSKQGQNLADKNPNWKGGHTFYQRFRKLACEICGVSSNKISTRKKVLNVHHKDHNRLNWNLNNLITLCETCHQKQHRLG